MILRLSLKQQKSNDNDDNDSNDGDDENTLDRS